MAARIQTRRFDAGSAGGPAAAGGAAYFYDVETEEAINVALRSGRPLVVGGPPGAGKSSLGLDVACRLGWRHYQELLPGRTDPRDLCYSLLDFERGAATPGTVGAGAQVVPGVLWWAFDPVSAAAQLDAVQARRGQHAMAVPRESAETPAVVLLDEVDAGPPSLPEVLLELLERRRFTVPELGSEVRARELPLVIMTTNARRPLAAAVADRCVVLILPEPNEDKLVHVGAVHFPTAPPELLHGAADALLDLSAVEHTPVNTRDYVSLVEEGVRLGVAPAARAAWAPLAARQLGHRRGSAVAEGPVVATAARTEGVRVFISYAREDAPMARQLHEDLARHGHAPWLDEEALLPGQNWRAAIERAMRESAFFLALLSGRSVSKTGYVQREMREAIRLLEEMPPDTVYVVPVRLEPCEPPYGALHDLHWVDLFPSYDDGLARIMRVIELVPRELKAGSTRLP
jgi:MoxR-like ATPase